MPDFWTHIIGGGEILDSMRNYQIKGKSINKLSGQYSKLFNFACQGPDFFFYNDFWPWKKTKRGPEAGRKIQLKKVSKLFLNSIEHIKYMKANSAEEEYQMMIMYFIGFLSHYVFDKNIHPFVIKKAKAGQEHKLLEILIDCYFVEKNWQLKAHLLSPVKVIDFGDSFPDVILKYYQFILSKIHGFPEDVNFINDSLQDMKRVLQLFYSPSGFKRVGFSLLNKIIPIDISMLVYPAEPDYDKLTSVEWKELDILKNQAVKEGIELTNIVFSYLHKKIEKAQLIKAFPEISFEGV